MDVTETSGWMTLGGGQRNTSIREADSQVQIPALKLGAWTSVSQGVPGCKQHRNIKEGERKTTEGGVAPSGLTGGRLGGRKAVWWIF